MTSDSPVVFVVDDDARVRDALTSLLASAGREVAVFASATDFLRADKPDVPACLVLDLELQGRSSIDVLRTVRSAGSKITIVVFSGHSHPEMIRHTLAAGADAYVPKNGDFELLLDAIRDKRATVAKHGTPR